MKTNTYPIAILSFALLLCSCAQKEQEKDKTEVSRNVEQIIPSEVKEKKIKKIFFSLPSPLELSMLFKKEGVNYFAESLHNVKKRDQYVTTVKQALNLGVYGADLSYAGLFGKHEDAIEYFATCQYVASDLSLNESFQKEFITRLEKNPNNKDTLLQVMSDFFLQNDSYLKLHHQSNISTFILVGGWIEGLYLGMTMISENTNAKGVRNIIIGQLNSLDNLIFLLHDVGKSQEMKSLKENMLVLRNYFNEVEYSRPDNGETLEVSDPKKELILGSDQGEAYMADSTFLKIKTVVTDIRSSIVR